MFRIQNYLFSTLQIIPSFFGNIDKFLSGSPVMTLDFVKELIDISPGKIHMKNKEHVNKLIQNIIEGGSNQLQVVSDFDRTITKQHDNGQTHISAFGIFARCKSLPPDFLAKDKELTAKYLPIELDPNIPLEEKRVLMEEWWRLGEISLAGLTVPEQELTEVIKSIPLSLRDDSLKLFHFLNDHRIPLLVFSAGIGDVIVGILQHFNILLPNVKVVSNFIDRDDKGVMKGFTGDKMINIFNKNEMILQGTPYYEKIQSRCNVIVMGDSIGDAGMADGLPNCNAVLKIGFLYGNIDGNLPNYKEYFDIVLEDDQTMRVVNALLGHLKN